MELRLEGESPMSVENDFDVIQIGVQTGIGVEIEKGITIMIGTGVENDTVTGIESEPGLGNVMETRKDYMSLNMNIVWQRMVSWMVIEAETEILLVTNRKKEGLVIGIEKETLICTGIEIGRWMEPMVILNLLTRTQISNQGNRMNQRSREASLDSNNDYNDEVKERLERSTQMRDELKKEISDMEEKLEDKQLVSNLRRRTQKLEDALITAKKRCSQHKIQLTELHKCFLHVKECSERLKRSEQELQSLVDSATIDIDLADDIGMMDGVLINGNA